MRVNVLYFAAARERAGCPSETVDVPAGARISALTKELERRHPALSALLPRLRFAVNQQFTNDDPALAEGDEVALIPPVAGGSGLFRLTKEPLSVDEAMAAVAGPDAGGTVVFVGTVRDQSRGKRVLRLEYEAYEAMALEQIERVAEEVRQKWPGVRIAVHHRYGRLEIGEAAVVIAVCGAHRQQAFAGCAHAIDRLKQDVPIWKKELYEDGEAWVGLGP